MRQVQANRLRFELARKAVAIAASQIDLTTESGKLRELQGGVQGPTAARDSIQALDSLLGPAQNGLLEVYVSYEVIRRNLDLDMGMRWNSPRKACGSTEERSQRINF